MLGLSLLSDLSRSRHSIGDDTKHNKSAHPTAGNAPVSIRASIPAVDELDVVQEMITPTTAVLLLIVILAIWALVDFAVVGSSVTGYFYRCLRARAFGSIEIETPPDLGVVVANGLLHAGSEIVAAYDAEWDGDKVLAYAISPEIVREPLGTRFQVLRVGPRRLELRTIKISHATKKPKANKSCEAIGDKVLVESEIDPPVPPH